MKIWKDENRETYKKMIKTRIDNIKKRKVITDKNLKIVEKLQKALNDLERREKIEKALKAAGYVGEPTYETLKNCFLDYVDAGYFTADVEDMISEGLITENDMIKSLTRKYNKLSL